MSKHGYRTAIAVLQEMVGIEIEVNLLNMAVLYLVIDENMNILEYYDS